VTCCVPFQRCNSEWLPNLALHAGCSGLRDLDHEEALVQLVDLLLHWDHLELTEVLGSLKLLHIESTEACDIESFGHDPKGVTHENLVDLVTR